MALPGMGDYDSDGDGGGASKAAPAEASPPAPPGEDFGPPPTTVLARVVDAAPAVVGALAVVKRPGSKAKQAQGAFGEMRTNLPAALVRAPVAGPSRSFGGGSHLQQMDLKASNVHAGGSVERAAIEEWSFDEQYHTFQSFGYAQDAAGGQKLVGDGAAAERPRPRAKRKRGDAAPLGTEDEHGVWAPEPEHIDEDAPEDLAARKAEIAEAVAKPKSATRAYDQNEDFDRRDERKISHLLPARHDRDTTAIEATHAFHGEALRDYQGRSWTRPNLGELRPKVDDDHDCFIPKRCVHKFTGHGKGVQCIKLHPTYGHLMLSASMDGSAKIWDVYNDRRCLMTYAGHAEAVRDATFSPDGSTFATCGFDRFTRVWDTETGAALHTLTPNRKMCYCVDFYPRDDKILLAGASDNRIYQWDLRANEEIVQEYNHHLQPVNSITFIDDDRRFVSTADDKKIFIWEHNIPVPMKYISEPHMNAVPVVELHPSTNFWCGQSLDNTIVTYGARDKLKQMRKKTFKGHLNSGYSCGITFSPNGKFIASGDGEGKLFFWDFKTTRVYRKLQAHDSGPCIGCAWHPLEPSWVFTCGWDGLIKLWD